MLVFKYEIPKKYKDNEYVKYLIEMHKYNSWLINSMCCDDIVNAAGNLRYYSSLLSSIGVICMLSDFEGNLSALS